MSLEMCQLARGNRCANHIGHSKLQKPAPSQSSVSQIEAIEDHRHVPDWSGSHDDLEIIGTAYRRIRGVLRTATETQSGAQHESEAG